MAYNQSQAWLSLFRTRFKEMQLSGTFMCITYSFTMFVNNHCLIRSQLSHRLEQNEHNKMSISPRIWARIWVAHIARGLPTTANSLNSSSMLSKQLTSPTSQDSLFPTVLSYQCYLISLPTVDYPFSSPAATVLPTSNPHSLTQCLHSQVSEFCFLARLENRIHVFFL